MTIKFECPFCEKPLTVKDELAGKKGPCPGCKKVVTIPAATPPPAVNGKDGKAPPVRADAAKKAPVVVKPPAKKPAAKGPASVKAGPPPEDLEAAAAALLDDEPPAEEAVPQFVEFQCPVCDEKIKLSAELAGKRGQCPECRNIVKVPDLQKKKEPKDWRQVKTGPSAAKENFEQPAPEGAWGSTTARGASRQALEEAGVIPVVREKLTLRQWIFRVGGGVAAASVLGVLAWTVWSMVSEGTNEKAITEALALVEGKQTPEAAEVRRAAGEYVLSTKKRNSVERAAKLFREARTALVQPGGIERDFRLIDLAVSQVDLGADKNSDEVTSGERLPWDKAQTEVLATLQLISSDDAKLAGVREVARKLVKEGRSTRAESIAQAALGSSENLRIEAPGLVGLETFAGKDTKHAETLAQQALENYPLVKDGGQPPDLSPSTAALFRLVWADNPGAYSPRLPDLAAGIQSKKREVQLGTIDATARKGDLAAARKMVGQLNDPADRVRALVSIGEQAMLEKPESAQPDVDEALNLISGGVRPSGWVVLGLASLAGHCGRAEQAQALAQAVDPQFKGQVQLLVLRGRLAPMNQAATEDELKGFDKNSLAYKLALEELARHNIQHDRGTFDAVRKWEDSLKPLGLVGAVLGPRVVE